MALGYFRILFQLNLLWMNWNLIKFCTCIDLNLILDGIVTCQFSQIYNSYGSWLSSEFYFCSIPPHTTYGDYPWFHHSVICSIFWERIDGIRPNFEYALPLTSAFDYCQNFIFVQYFGNELMELDQVLHMHWCWQRLYWNCCTSVFTNKQHSYGPWLLSKFSFRSISWKQIWCNLTQV